MLLKYKDELEKAKKTKAIKDDGTELPVDSELVSNTAKALKDAETLVAKICDQATLAISVE
jgi:hypothetical protein